MEKLVTEVIRFKGTEKSLDWPQIQKEIDNGYTVKSFQQSYQAAGLSKLLIITACLVKP